MVLALMPQRSSDKTKNGIVCGVAAFILFAPLSAASAMDPMDRKMEIEMNRDRAESRIERLREDQRRNRPRKDTNAVKKRDDNTKRRPQRLQY